MVFVETIADVKENAGGAIADIVFNPKSIGRIRRAIRWLGTCEVDFNEN